MNHVCYSGQKNKFVVRTANAGAGTLAVFIEGPSRSALSCKELDEGYEFIYTPFSPGNYLITIKYGNIRIAGSPFQAVATGTTWCCFLTAGDQHPADFSIKFFLLQLSGLLWIRDRRYPMIPLSLYSLSDIIACLAAHFQ